VQLSADPRQKIGKANRLVNPILAGHLATVMTMGSGTLEPWKWPRARAQSCGQRAPAKTDDVAGGGGVECCETVRRRAPGVVATWAQLARFGRSAVERLAERPPRR
jgi:hypothetical protein